MATIRLTITKDQYPYVSKFLSLIGSKLDPKSDLSYYLKFGFPTDLEFIELLVNLDSVSKPVTDWERTFYNSVKYMTNKTPKQQKLFDSIKDKMKD